MRLTKDAPSAHDKAVQRIARQHKKDGWNVAADLSGWPSVPDIGGEHPDIFATKRGHTRIIEIETSAHADAEQHDKFRRSARARGRNAVFISILVDKQGREIKRSKTSS